MTATLPPLGPTSEAWQHPGIVDTIAAGLDLATPVRVIVPPDGHWQWRDRCSVCHLSRAECSAWEAHQVQRRRVYADRTGLPYELWRCGRCGELVGAGVVQRDGLRYCDEAHAALDVVVVYKDDDAPEVLVGVAEYGRRVSR